jgi:hypothetical protein
MMDIEKIREFAKSQGYKNVQYLGKWREYDVYEPLTGEGVACIGLPFIVLVQGDTIRMSTEKEAFQQIRETSND